MLFKKMVNIEGEKDVQLVFIKFSMVWSFQSLKSMFLVPSLFGLSHHVVLVVWNFFWSFFASFLLMGFFFGSIHLLVM